MLGSRNCPFNLKLPRAVTFSDRLKRRRAIQKLFAGLKRNTQDVAQSVAQTTFSGPTLKGFLPVSY